MKRIAAVFLIFGVILLIIGCSKQQPQPELQPVNDWQQQYDLGIKYLNEGNYEEAIIAFTAAIEINPKNSAPYIGRGESYIKLKEQLDLARADYEKAIELDNTLADAYLGLADVYIRLGEFDKALEVLEKGQQFVQDERLNQKIEEIKSGNITDSSGQIRRMSAFDSNGALIFYHEYAYKDGMQSAVTSYNASGQVTGHVELTYNQNGMPLRSYYYLTETGEVGAIEYVYDSEGNEIEYLDYDLSGNIRAHSVSEYDANGQRIKEIIYSPDGTMDMYFTFEYDALGREIRRSTYDNNGFLMYYDTRKYVDGKLKEYAMYNSGGQLERVRIYEHDATGKQVGWKEYDGSGNLLGSGINQ